MTPPPGAGAALSELGAALAAAPDLKLAKIVAELERAAPEARSDRGATEAVIGKLRPRLAQLHPRRPMSLSRLAFTPLDSVIVPPTRWTRASLAVPRTALAPLWVTIAARLGGEAAGLRAALADAPDQAFARVGTVLWPRAAAILRDAAPPSDWQEATGLDAASHQALASRLAAVLGQAPALVALEAALARGVAPPEAALGAWLAPFADDPMPTLATGIAILLTRLPGAEAGLALIEEPARVIRTARQDATAAADAALGFVLDAAANVRASGSAAGAEAARRATLLLLGLEARARERPARLARIRAARQAADSRLRASFAEAISTQLAASRVATAPSTTLEASARALRRFAGAARHLGSADAYDAAIREAASALAPAPGANAVARLAHIRLVEILAGSDAASALLAEGDNGG